MPNVLIISYHFPPAAGPGSQRLASFARSFAASGWDTTCLTVEEKSLGSRDETGLQGLDGIRVVRTKILQPHTLFQRVSGNRSPSESEASLSGTSKGSGIAAKLGMWLRKAFFVPDARIGWMLTAVPAAMKILAEENVDLILTSGPPFTTHLIGAAIKKKSGIPWIADFRDPWLGAYFAPERPFWAAALELRQQNRVMSSADAVTTVGPWFSNYLMEQAQKAELTKEAEGQSQRKKTPFEVIYNGFDGEPVKETPEVPDLFRIIYVGTVNDAENPAKVFKAAENLALKREDFRKKLRLETAGRMGNNMVDLWSDGPIGDCYTHHGFVPHSEAKGLMNEAALLIVAIPEAPTSMGILSGKLMEYLGSGRPILVAGPSEGDAAWTVSHTGSGEAARDEVDALEPAIERAFERFLTGNPLPERNLARVKEFSRENQGQKLVRLAEELVQDKSNAIER